MREWFVPTSADWPAPALPDDGEVLRTTAFEALLGEVLRECARDPLLLLEASAAGETVIRIARDREPVPDGFDEILLEAMESASDALIGWTTAQLGNRTDAEDIVQTALMRVYARRPAVANPDEMRAYLWTTVKNLVKDAWRRSATDRDRLAPDGDERLALLATQAGLPFDDLITLRHFLIAALDHLPQREREALVLRTYEGNTYAETAEIMGLASGTIKAYVHNALQKIRAGLEAA
ncbi:RNA polymerase sigma factor [Nocardia huaxiensis]|uniref:RNA polymerase sigma factor n=1 Tax=Nocardia huaxiensis TaxID=2755382 RepID=A0A7D6VCK4_9NOCA|nr:RNA polymerase sigma factor [Nocardia huaxiensis]QLY32274.1 RNA polymerase sigma factor [Nocardia huaxiensis]UFS94022.1 RNA polymerase sigma factor [Nocardia huaxiensis]